MKTFSKVSFPLLSQKNGPRGGAFYQIPPDVALTTCIQPYSKSPKKAIFGTPNACFLDSAPERKRGGPHENIFKRLIDPIFSKK